MSYTTVDNVANYLGVTIDGSSTPSDTTVEKYIDWIEDEIDHITKNTYESTSNVEVILDVNSDSSFSDADTFDGTNPYDLPSGWNRIKLPYNDVLTLDELYFNTESDPSAEPVWDEIDVIDDSGSSGSVKLINDSIKLLNSSNLPRTGPRAIKAIITRGESTLPPYVEKIATRMVALEIMSGKSGNEVYNGGGNIRVGDIQIGDSGNFSSDFIRATQNEVEYYLDKLGTINTVLI